MAAKSKKAVAQTATKQIAVRWNIDKSVTTMVATNLVVQTNTDGIFLSFFEAIPPILTGTAEAVQEEMKNLGAVDANCIARISIPVSRFPEFVQVLNKSLEGIKKTLGTNLDE